MPTGTSGCNFPEHHKSGGGGGLWLVVAAIAAVIIAARTSTAARLASDLLETLTWIAVGLATAGVAGAVTVVLVRRSHRRARADRAVALAVAAARHRAELAEQRQPIEAPRTVPGHVIGSADELPVRRERGRR